MKISTSAAIASVALPLGIAASTPAGNPQCGVLGDGTHFYATLKVSSVGDCQTICQNDAQCLSSEYKTTTNACWLFNQPISQAKTSDQPSGTWIMNDKNCAIPSQGPPQCGVLGDGSSFYTKVTVGSVADCQNICQSDSKCLSSEYKTTTKDCWLYSMPVAKAKTSNQPSGTWVMNDKNCAVPPQGPPQCGVLGDGTAFYTSLTAASMADCQSACQNDAKCLSSEFKPSENKCWLFSLRVAQVKTSDQPSGKWIMNDKGCAIPQCNVLGDGDSFYESLQTPDIAKCQSACEDDPYCLSSEYKKTTNQCWLFSLPVAHAKTNDQPSGTWIMNDKGCAIPQCNVLGDGSSFYTVLKTTDMAGCMSACHSDSKCLSSEYKKTTNQCWLFDKPVSQAKTSDNPSGTWIMNEKNCH